MDASKKKPQISGTQCSLFTSYDRIRCRCNETSASATTPKWKFTKEVALPYSCIIWILSDSHLMRTLHSIFVPRKKSGYSNASNIAVHLSVSKSSHFLLGFVFARAMQVSLMQKIKTNRESLGGGGWPANGTSQQITGDFCLCLILAQSRGGQDNF